MIEFGYDEKTEAKQELITVIVPVYNRSYCLHTCLDSIKNQSYPNWECVVIDDGSTDSTWDICEKYVRNDCRFRAYHQENKGVSVARNNGIKNAKGTYICFVDSDDYLRDNCLERLAYHTSKGMLAMGGMRVKEEGKADVLFTFPEMCISLHSLYEDEIISLQGTMPLYSPCAKLFDRIVIEHNQLYFPEDIHSGEDIIFIYRYLRFVEKIYIIPDDLYIVVKTKNSLSTAAPDNYLEIRHAILNSIIAFCIYKGLWNKKMKNCIGNMYLYAANFYLYDCYLSNNTHSLIEKYKLFAQKVDEIDPSYLQGCLTHKWHVFFLKMSNPLILWLIIYTKHIWRNKC
ncbi:glycosyltransferase family 2 protein [Parabacteroides bouchesdurhonensis]|uniref:glycosyltransferase family 2 protein n=1 Tax=Parabacteroides bouchesdurhonensis TaxID=1936995 RepID=UPI000C846205|nr:glycosyltransferase family 2 protein [Parabacteroides bouchesdurhonensis]